VPRLYNWVYIYTELLNERK
jgi:hypothetical protein